MVRGQIMLTEWKGNLHPEYLHPADILNNLNVVQRGLLELEELGCLLIMNKLAVIVEQYMQFCCS